MSHVSCPDCGLRFTPAFAAHTRSCPMCCGPLTICASAADVVGQQLFFDPPADPPVVPPSAEGGA